MNNMFVNTLEKTFDKWFAEKNPDLDETNPMYGKYYKKACERFMKTLLILVDENAEGEDK